MSALLPLSARRQTAVEAPMAAVVVRVAVDAVGLEEVAGGPVGVAVVDAAASETSAAETPATATISPRQCRPGTPSIT